jgi:hypothetical protein
VFVGASLKSPNFKKSLSLKFLKVNRGDVAAYAATSLRLTFKNFKLGEFLKFGDFNEAPTNSLMMIY